jgi:hypothetical protein
MHCLNGEAKERDNDKKVTEIRDKGVKDGDTKLIIFR